MNWGKPIENNSYKKEFFEYMVEWPAVPIPSWMQDIIEQECNEFGIREPAKMVAKYLDSHPRAYLRDGTGGYTIHGEEGEICVAYQIGKFFGTPQELNTLLHELAHWLAKDFDYESGGHTPKFYKEYIRLVLKYNGNLELLFEDYDYEYGGANLFPGIELFDLTYNQGS